MAKSNKEFDIKSLKNMSAKQSFNIVLKTSSSAYGLYRQSLDMKYLAIAQIRWVLRQADKKPDYLERLKQIIEKNGVEESKNFKLDLLLALHGKTHEDLGQDSTLKSYLYSMLRVLNKLDEKNIKLQDSYKYIKEQGIDALSNNREKDKTVEAKVLCASSDSTPVPVVVTKIQPQKAKDCEEAEAEDESKYYQKLFESSTKGILKCWKSSKTNKIKKALLEVARLIDDEQSLGLVKIVKDCVSEVKNEK